jgi:hypothetical protein
MADTKKELVKNIRGLNKLKLTSRVSVKGDEEDLLEDFITAIEKIDDDGKIGKVSDSILDFYEEQIADAAGDGDSDGGDFDADALAEELEDMSLKEMRAYVKDNDIDVGRITTKNKDDKVDEVVEAMEAKSGDDGDDGDDDGEEFDADALAEELEDMSLKDMRAFVKENDLDVGRITTKNKADKVDEIVEAMEEKAEGDDGDDGDDGDEVDLEEMDEDELLDFAEENDIKLTERQEGMKAVRLRKIIQKKLDASGGSKPAGKTGKAGKKSGELPTGVRKGTMVADFYEAIADGGATIAEMAKPLAKAKGKEPAQMYGVVSRNIVRKLAKAVSVCMRPDKNGEDGSVMVTLDD